MPGRNVVSSVIGGVVAVDGVGVDLVVVEVVEVVDVGLEALVAGDVAVVGAVVGAVLGAVVVGAAVAVTGTLVLDDAAV